MADLELIAPCLAPSVASVEVADEAIPAPLDAPLVGDLLRDSHRAHTNAKRFRRDGDVDRARQWLLEAERTRLAAHDADPDHLDGAWTTEQSQGYAHEPLLLFYTTEREKDLASQRLIAKARAENGAAIVAESVTAVGK